MSNNFELIKDLVNFLYDNEKYAKVVKTYPYVWGILANLQINNGENDFVYFTKYWNDKYKEVFGGRMIPITRYQDDFIDVLDGKYIYFGYETVSGFFPKPYMVIEKLEAIWENFIKKDIEENYDEIINNLKQIETIDFDKKIWQSDSFSFYLLNENQTNKQLFDQEDIMQFQHKQKNLTVDVGVYGDWKKFPGYTILVVENYNWEKPILKKVIKTSFELKFEVEQLLRVLDTT